MARIGPWDPGRLGRWLAGGFAVAFFYFAGAVVCNQWSLPPYGLAPLNLATGVAVSSVLLVGYGVWPAVVVGAFAAQLAVGAAASQAAVLAVTAGVQAVFAAWLIRTTVGGGSPLANGRRLFLFAASVFLAMPLSALVDTAVAGNATQAALVGVASWTSHALGALLLVPLVAAWGLPLWRPGERRDAESVILVVLASLAAALVFAPALAWRGPYPVGAAFILLYLWSGFRRGPRTVTTMAVVVAASAATATAAGRGPYAALGAYELPVLQAFLVVSTAVGFSICALVAERSRAAQALRRERDFGDKLVDTAQVAVLLLDPRGRILRFNAYLEAVTGYSSAEVQGRDWLAMFIAPEERHRVSALFREAVRGESSLGNVNAVVTRDGGRRYVEWHDSVVRDENGDVAGLLAVGQDITVRRKTEEQLRAYREHLERLVEERSEAISRTNAELVLEVEERGRAERALERSRRQLLAAQRMTGIGSWEWDLEQDRVACSDPLHALAGGGHDEPTEGLAVLLAHVHPADREMVREGVEAVRRTWHPMALEHRMADVQGNVRFVHHRAEVDFDAEGRPVRIYGTVHDITAEKEAREQLRQAAAVFDNTTEAIAVIDRECAVKAVNKAFSEITGYQADEVIGQSLSVIHADEASYRSTIEELDRSGRWRGEMRGRYKSGEVYPVWGSVSEVREPDGTVSGYVAVFTDIRAIKAHEERLSYLAHHDALTDLPNRLLFEERLDHALTRARRHEGRVGLMCLDVDRFKSVNDTYGHAAGDGLLRTVAERLRGIVRAEDTVARISGDEFMIIMEELSHSEDAALLADKIIRDVARPVAIDGRTVETTVSIGIAVFPDDADTPDDLAKAADSAMYYAKHHGRNTYRFFTAEMTSRAETLLSLESGLHRAIERQEFVLHYQPQVSLQTGRVVGAEALLRWSHPEEGLVPPQRFLSVAEDSGLIEPIGQWVIEAVCRQVSRWHEQGYELPRVGINLSARQLNPGLIRLFDSLLERYPIPQRFVVELEVDERSLTEVVGLGEAWESLYRRGVMLTVDRFGGGGAPLGALAGLHADMFKIEPSITADVGGPGEGMVDAIIQLAHRLSSNVVAAGVERGDQIEFLRAHGCDEVQGYALSEPLPAPRMAEVLRRQRA